MINVLSPNHSLQAIKYRKCLAVFQKYCCTFPNMDGNNCLYKEYKVRVVIYVR